MKTNIDVVIALKLNIDVVHDPLRRRWRGHALGFQLDVRLTLTA